VYQRILRSGLCQYPPKARQVLRPRAQYVAPLGTIKGNHVVRPLSPRATSPGRWLEVRSPHAHRKKLFGGPSNPLVLGAPEAQVKYLAAAPGLRLSGRCLFVGP
jgi:hypothetical protein